MAVIERGRAQPSLRRISLTVTTRPLVAQALNSGFAQYIAPIHFTADDVATRFAAEDLDMGRSWILLQEETPVGAVLLTRRGARARLAALAIAPHLRGQGHGRAALQRAIRVARDAKATSLSLEVIEQNAPARALYASAGFIDRRRLLAFAAPTTPPPRGDCALHKIPPHLAVRAIEADRSWPQAPWQAQPATLERLALQAFTIDGDAVALVEPSRGRLQAVHVRPAQRLRGKGRELLQALRALWASPAGPLHTATIFPEEPFAAFFSACGWSSEPINQVEVEMPLPTRKPQVTRRDPPVHAG